MDTYISVGAGRVFRRVLREWGYDPVAWIASAQVQEKERVADAVNAALSVIWQQAMWPQIMRVERVTYRAEYSAVKMYAADDEVFKRGADSAPVYYRCLAACVGADPATSSDKWARAPADFLPGVIFSSYAIDEVDLAACCFDRHPDRVADLVAYLMKRTSYGACVANPRGGFPVEPYLRFRPLPPEVTWMSWNIATPYSEGEKVFDEDQAWIALRPNTGAKPGASADDWEEVNIPQMFENYVVISAAVERKKDEEGRMKQYGRAEAEANRLNDVYRGQIRERRRAHVRVSR